MQYTCSTTESIAMNIVDDKVISSSITCINEAIKINSLSFQDHIHAIGHRLSDLIPSTYFTDAARAISVRLSAAIPIVRTKIKEDIIAAAIHAHIST